MAKHTPPVHVTKPSLPPLAELIPILEDIWRSRVLTNEGPYHQRFESELARYLGVREVSLVTSATLGLLLVLKALGLEGEVITTPMSFVATAHVLTWCRLSPVFVDIDPRTLNIDAGKIERAITSRTCAILPVHCYGNACDTEAIAQIARSRGLKVVYDAAHAFGVELGGRSVFDYGDASVVSFHATKVLNTFEGGAVVATDERVQRRIDELRNFGIAHDPPEDAPGINAKMNEFSAALGVLQLTRIDDSIRARAALDTRYRELLSDVPSIHCLQKPLGQTSNFSYFPILIEDDYGASADQLCARLADNGIMARRYFYPLISTLPAYRDLPSAAPENLPAATEVARKVVCLPLFPDMTLETQDDIVAVVRAAGQTSRHDRRASC